MFTDTNLCFYFEDGFTEEQLKESLSRVDMKKCTVRSLRRASENGGIPSNILATAALDLCDGLQEKLDASTKIIQVNFLLTLLC